MRWYEIQFNDGAFLRRVYANNAESALSKAKSKLTTSQRYNIYSYVIADITAFMKH